MKTISCASSFTLIDRIPAARMDVNGLKRIFKTLANETRLRMLHSLIRAKELCVNEIAVDLGMKPQAISNQLQKMVDLGIVGSRRDGNNIYYRIVDPCVPEILDRTLCLIETSRSQKRKPVIGRMN